MGDICSKKEAFTASFFYPEIAVSVPLRPVRVRVPFGRKCVCVFQEETAAADGETCLTQKVRWCLPVLSADSGFSPGFQQETASGKRNLSA